MESALGWIGDIIRWLLNIIPRLVLVRATHGAVKFIRARTKVIGPGLHIWWPITTEVELAPVVRQVLSLEQQVIQTADGKTVIADGVLVYAIKDLHKFLVENFDAEENMTELAEAALRQAIIRETYDEINSGRVKLDNRLAKEAGQLLEPFGIVVETMRLQSCAEGTVLIHAGAIVEFSVGGED